MGTLPTTPSSGMSFFQRLSAPTPAFWRKVQLICLILSLLVAWLDKFHVIPDLISAILAGAFAAIAFVAQCAVDDGALLKNALHDPLSLITSAPLLLEQLIKAIQLAKSPPGETTEEIIDKIKELSNQPDKTIVAAAISTESTTGKMLSPFPFASPTGDSNKEHDINDPNKV